MPFSGFCAHVDFCMNPTLCFINEVPGPGPCPKSWPGSGPSPKTGCGHGSGLGPGPGGTQRPERGVLPRPGCSPPLGYWPSFSGCCSGWCWLWRLTWSADEFVWRATGRGLLQGVQGQRWETLRDRKVSESGVPCELDALRVWVHRTGWVFSVWFLWSDAEWRCACRRSMLQEARHTEDWRRCSVCSDEPERQNTGTQFDLCPLNQQLDSTWDQSHLPSDLRGALHSVFHLRCFHDHQSCNVFMSLNTWTEVQTCSWHVPDVFLTCSWHVLQVLYVRTNVWVSVSGHVLDLLLKPPGNMCVTCQSESMWGDTRTMCGSFPVSEWTCWWGF